MNLYPSIDELKTYAASGSYTVCPVCTEMLSDFITPIEALRILKAVSTHAYLLESAQASEAWGRLSAGSSGSTGVPVSPSFHPLPVAWWDISPLISWATASPPSSGRLRIMKSFRMWI